MPDKQRIGLSPEAVLNMGNSLFSVVLGSVMAVTSLLLYDASFEFPSAPLERWGRTVLIVGIAVLVLYYLIDWYDLNLMVVVDTFVGRRQIFIYVICALFIGSLPPLALQGNVDLLGILSSVYFPLADFQRNRFINPEDYATSSESGRAIGRVEGYLLIGRVVLWILSLGLLGVCTYCLWYQAAEPALARFSGSVLVLLLWLMAATLKLVRSVTFIELLYIARTADSDLQLRSEKKQTSQPVRKKST